jgi:hypothetical protein
MNQDFRQHCVMDMKVVVMDQDDYMSITNRCSRQHCVIDMIVFCGTNCDLTKCYVVATGITSSVHEILTGLYTVHPL